MAYKLPTFLNYTKSISPSEGMMYSLIGDREIPIEVNLKTVRGAIGNYQTDPGLDSPEDDAGKARNPAGANIQRIDTAFLDPEADGIVIRYSVVIQNGAMAPSGCNDPVLRARLNDAVALIKDKGGFDALAERYAWNIVNARGMWRNRIASEKKVEVTIGDETLAFHGDNVPTFKYPGKDAMPGNFQKLLHLISTALTDETKPLFAEIRMSGKMPKGAEVYPSQEFIEKTTSVQKQGDKSKSLSHIPRTFAGRDIKQATMHSQKLGNALRTIDEWHGQVDEIGASAIETYGYSQSNLKTLRFEGREARDGVQSANVFSLIQNIDDLIASIEKADTLPGDALYFAATLVRGGVFSGESDKKKKAAKEESDDAAA